MGTWRKRAKKIIALALADARRQGVKMRELKRFIGQYYDRYRAEGISLDGPPPRKKYPYRVWCDEVKSAIEFEKMGAQQTRLAFEFGS